MRLFIAINFSQSEKESIYNWVLKLKNCAKKGSFTLKENLHLTLVFIGETNDEAKIKQAMDKTEFSPFDIKLSKIGRFIRRDGDIYYIVVEENKELSEVYDWLFKNLSDLGFKLENRDFKPHITLARRVVLDEDLGCLEFDMSISVNQISLMKSERISNRLTYSETYKKSGV